MRISLAADSLLERVGTTLGLAPVPVGYAFFGMPVARAVPAAQRLGVFGALAASGPLAAEELAARLGVRAGELRMLLDLLCGQRILRARGGRYALRRSARRWLDPASDRYVGTYLEHTHDYWPWWAELETAVRTGRSFDIHAVAPDDPAWPVYIRGQYELARLSADDVARALALPAEARSVLDLAGGHGWYAAALCRRRPGLRATVLDLPGSVAVGREIIRETGMRDAVRHVEGDMFEADLGGPHDAALLFSIVHHLKPDAIVALLRRVRASLAPGGVVAVLDLFRPEPRERPRASAAAFGLFFTLTSDAGIPSEAELRGWLAAAGFGPPERLGVRTLPDLRLYRARAA